MSVRHRVKFAKDIPLKIMQTGSVLWKRLQSDILQAKCEASLLVFLHLFTIQFFSSFSNITRTAWQNSYYIKRNKSEKSSHLDFVSATYNQALILIENTEQSMTGKDFNQSEQTTLISDLQIQPSVKWFTFNQIWYSKAETAAPSKLIIFCSR